MNITTPTSLLYNNVYIIIPQIYFFGFSAFNSIRKTQNLARNDILYENLITKITGTNINVLIFLSAYINYLLFVFCLA